MEMSITTMSGLRLAAPATASRPLDASPQTSQSGRNCWIDASTPRLTSSWSSATSMRVFFIAFIQRQSHNQRRAHIGRSDFQASAELFGACPHTQDAHSKRDRSPPRLRWTRGEIAGDRSEEHTSELQSPLY